MHSPDFIVCVPLVLDAWHRRILAQIKLRSHLTRFFIYLAFMVGTAYIRARRVLEGTAIHFARNTPSQWVTVRAHLVAGALHWVYR